MKSRLILIPCMLVLSLLLLAAARLGFVPRGTPLDVVAPEAAFVREWSRSLRAAESAENASQRVRQNKEGGQVLVCADGSWVSVVMEHACCTGAGFDATLYVTSSGEAYLDTTTRYCGAFDLADSLHVLPRTDSASLISSLASSGKRLIRL